jgi:phenylacetate-coenzyme A ligase PaaK-like adenylate-forming protein
VAYALHLGEAVERAGDGEVGELVVTSLTKECSPVLRYRTRDLSRVTRERCPCGRTSARMHKVIGRTDDMFIISGVNVFVEAGTLPRCGGKARRVIDERPPDREAQEGAKIRSGAGP